MQLKEEKRNGITHKQYRGILQHNNTYNEPKESNKGSRSLLKFCRAFWLRFLQSHSSREGEVEAIQPGKSGSNINDVIILTVTVVSFLCL